MVLGKRDTTREAAMKVERLELIATTVARTTFRTASQHTIEPLLEIMPSAMKVVANCERRFHWPSRETRVRQQGAVKFLSPARVWLCDATKTVAVKGELTAAGGDDFGWSPRQPTNGRQRFLSGVAVVGSNAIRAAQAARPVHSSEPLTPAEECSARAHWYWMARGLSAKKLFASFATRQALGTAG